MDILKNKFYKYSITKRILIVITLVSIFSTSALVISNFLIMKKQLFMKTESENIKDITMIEQELNLFMNNIRNDAVSVLVSDSCQKVLENFEDKELRSTITEYEKYKMLQSMIMSTVGQRGIYNTIVLYDVQGNGYVDDKMDQSEDYVTAQVRIKAFLNSGENESIFSLHKSAWKEKKESEYKDCISYVRKVYGMETGKLIGAVELEITNEQLSSLYQPVLSNGKNIMVLFDDTVISSASKEDLYKSVGNENWFQKKKNNLNYVIEKENIYFLKPYAEFGWYIVCVAPIASYMREVQVYAVVDILIGVVLLMTNILICRVLIVSITKPLSKITKTIVDIGKGNYQHRISVRDGGEIGTLATEFNRMVEQTQILMNQIVEKEEEKREAELSLIQMQMTPHFFYNILESICGLIVIDEKKLAIRTINYLSEFYRGVLSNGKEVILIENELKIAVNYLEIMKICHPGKFDYKIICPEIVKQNKIIKMTLQPILENAIHHGFVDMASGGIITINGKVEDQKIILEIADNGVGMEKEISLDDTEMAEYHMESFGLANTNRRISLYFGPEYGIKIINVKKGTEIKIILPEEAGEKLC